MDKKKYPWWRDKLNLKINRFLCSIFGHWWVPSKYTLSENTHEDCMLCKAFRVKGGQK